MSRNGPSLRRAANGYAFAKFNGKEIHFGRFADPRSHDEFDRFRAQWLLNGRVLPE